ncbi:molybdenum cofactor guanylyltransferase [Ornithinibacillus californiensis]|uniref:molybdenum cofactor guanylyltransferase n=1 Tax=Ornithinibacillus californiensis TaxID=161536 RepID=UPI00069EA55C|nr:molybdenum cofactor guanylyltransferase [Ornithinibacillus californiensis]
MKHSISGIILAGGKSSRFGSPKAFARKDGIPFYQSSIDKCKPFIETITLVTSIELVKKFNIPDPDIYVITDKEDIAGLGPLAGIYSGMEKVDSEWYLISPIDVPFLEGRILKMLLQKIEVGKEVIVPMVNGRVEPLIAVYHRSLKGKIIEQLKRRELAPKQLFERSQVVYVEIDDEKPFRNINYRDDLDRYTHMDERGGERC